MLSSARTSANGVSLFTIAGVRGYLHSRGYRKVQGGSGEQINIASGFIVVTIRHNALTKLDFQ